jgi:hypothetical protein
MKITFFSHVTMCAVVDIYQRFEGKYCHHLQGKRVKVSNLNIKAVRSSEMSVCEVILPDYAVSSSRKEKY